MAALGQEWWDGWHKGVPDSFGNIDAEGQAEGSANTTDFATNPFGINFTARGRPGRFEFLSVP